jgi:hypothetical protein
LRFTELQLSAAKFWLDPMLQEYFKLRYGASWQWYWLNYEINQEILL